MREMVRLFVCHIFWLHGLPECIVSDQSTQFMAWFWRAHLELLHVQVRLSSSHHPETDGGMAWMNAILEQYLHCYMNYQQDILRDLLVPAEFAYNNAQHASTCLSLFLVTYGFHLHLFLLTTADSHARSHGFPARTRYHAPSVAGIIRAGQGGL